MEEWFQMAMAYLLQALMLAALGDQWLIVWGTLSTLWGTLFGILRSAANRSQTDPVRFIPQELPQERQNEEQQNDHQLPKAA